MSIKCLKCGMRESTGILIKMCDPCFDEFEAKTLFAELLGKKYVPTDEEVACIGGDGE